MPQHLQRVQTTGALLNLQGNQTAVKLLQVHESSVCATAVTMNVRNWGAPGR